MVDPKLSHMLDSVGSCIWRTGFRTSVHGNLVCTRDLYRFEYIFCPLQSGNGFSILHVYLKPIPPTYSLYNIQLMVIFSDFSGRDMSLKFTLARSRRADCHVVAQILLWFGYTN